MPIGWTNDPPDPHTSRATRVEHNACQTALRAAGIPVWRVRNAAGLERVDSGLTFSHLVEYASFPVLPSVTAEPLDDVQKLLLKFDKTRLYAAWLAAWDARPQDRVGQRYLVAHGADTGLVVVTDSQRPDDRPHLYVGHASDLRLTVEPFSAWVKSLHWPSDADDR